MSTSNTTTPAPPAAPPDAKTKASSALTSLVQTQQALFDQALAAGMTQGQIMGVLASATRNANRTHRMASHPQIATTMDSASFQAFVAYTFGPLPSNNQPGSDAYVDQFMLDVRDAANGTDPQALLMALADLLRIMWAQHPHLGDIKDALTATITL